MLPVMAEVLLLNLHIKSVYGMVVGSLTLLLLKMVISITNIIKLVPLGNEEIIYIFIPPIPMFKAHMVALINAMRDILKDIKSSGKKQLFVL